MKKEVEIFDEKRIYLFDAEVENDIKILEEFKKEVNKYHILDTMNIVSPISFDIRLNGADHIGNILIDWIYGQNKNEKESVESCLLRCSIEDESWTKQRNEGLTSICFRKIIFLPEIQKVVIDKIDKYIIELEKLLSDFDNKKKQIQKRKDKWKTLNVFEFIAPSGGENRRDGYFDAEYISSNGNIVRMVSRDVFDVGCYSYPKRLEGESAFDKSLYTLEELDILNWISEFGKFKGIRM